MMEETWLFSPTQFQSVSEYEPEFPHFDDAAFGGYSLINLAIAL